MSYLNKRTNKKLWQWSIASNKAKCFLQALEPFLREKKEQALVAIGFQLNRATLDFTERDALRVQLHRLKNNRREIKNYAKFI